MLSRHKRPGLAGKLALLDQNHDGAETASDERADEHQELAMLTHWPTPCSASCAACTARRRASLSARWSAPS